MLENMRRLHPRGAASRGICVDANGAMLGPDCVLVQRTSRGYRSIERGAATTLQKAIIGADRESDWLFRQAGRIADALDKGEIALAQIYGLHIPIYELDNQQLAKLAAAAHFSILKRGIVGTYHHVSAGHLHRYLAEFDFRYNERAANGVDDTQRAAKAIEGAAGKRLTYRQAGRRSPAVAPF
jgi:ISXO2-like transposase domain